jgi:hypothetical protein
MSIKPKIDDQFWFDMSYDMINDSIKRLKEGASKLQNLLLWAFGIYTGSAVFTIEYKNINEIGILIILSLPYLLLIIGYWYAHIAQLPTTVEFDYRSPTQIEKAYINGYNNSKKSLNFSKWLTFLGLFTLAISLMLAFILKNQSQDEEYLNVGVNKTSSTILITGNFPANKELEIQMISYYDKDSTSIHLDTLLNSTSGLFFKSYPIDLDCKKITFEVGWSSQKYSHKLIKEITTNNVYKKLP